ncbi:MAG TPA: phosphate-starvation-inducible PsiE family protein [Nitrospira sp.]|nr:phosphate-starvation-inducible PsiE family protein [Nitrospira sp.]
MMDREVATVRQSPTNRWAFFDGVLGDRTIGLMEALDGLGYVTTGVSFLAVSIVLFVRAWYVFAIAVGSDAVLAVLGLVHDLLLVIILLELFRTTINFLKTKVITLEPFLYICVIASTRRILTTGAQVSYMDELTDLVFNRYLMDLGANVLVVVALIIAIYVSRRASPPVMAEGAETVQCTDRTGERAESCPQETDEQIVRLKKEYA